MSNSQLLSRISINPNICGGKPCIKGHRIWISLILDFLASGATMKEILEDYPQLETKDIFACISYASELINGQI
jgi:uncharacterized protein (DUF433 family)